MKIPHHTKTEQFIYLFAVGVFGLGLACQAKGHSNRIPTFQTLPRIYGKKKNRGKVRTTACKAYQCASKKARGNKNIFSVEHDS